MYLECRYFSWKAVFNARKRHSFGLCVTLVFASRAILRSPTDLEVSNLLLFFFASEPVFLFLLAMALCFTQLAFSRQNRLQ